MDLNADLGEGFDDGALAPWITSASVACGYHAGDPATMEQTVRLCRAHGVAVGAHPSLPDRAGFGRIERAVLPGEVFGWVGDQMRALGAACQGGRVPLRHVKPHGALYHLAARDAPAAREVAEAVRAFDPCLILIAPPRSALARAGRRANLRVAEEAFVERGYLADGGLAPRGLPGALVDDPREAAKRAVRLCREGAVTTVEGRELTLRAQTLCLHGDSPGAAATARAVREALEAAGFEVAPL